MLRTTRTKKALSALTIVLAITLLVALPVTAETNESEEYVLQPEMQELNKELVEAIRMENTVQNNVDSRRLNIHNQKSSYVDMGETRETGAVGMSRASFMPPYPRVIEYRRTGRVIDDITRYTIKVRFGPGENDTKILPGYVKETSLFCTEANKLLLIMPGQSLTEGFYSEMAIHFAQKGYSVVILNRRESGMVNLSDMDMANWTNEDYLNDMYYDIVISRVHTSLLSTEGGLLDIKVYATAHSISVNLLADYEAKGYDDKFFGNLDGIIPVDMIVKYNPAYTELIGDHRRRHNNITSDIENGSYYNDDMAGMIGVASTAIGAPNEYWIHPNFTNIELFRMMASQTYLFEKCPCTPDYHYWTGDISGLRYADEQKILSATVTGGAVPYSPLILDQRAEGLMGNVYDINSTEIDPPVLGIGFGGGCTYHVGWWWIEEVGETNDNVMFLNWRNRGHASLVMDYNSPELWDIMDYWMRGLPE